MIDYGRVIKRQPKCRFHCLSSYSKMEKDECNIMAAKAFNARLNGDRKKATVYESELEDLRSGKRRRIDQRNNNHL